MTDVLHTADIHLRAGDRTRLAGLEAVLEKAEELDVELLTIAGDLFDGGEDVDALRHELRNRLFTDLPFEILLIPGNHDVRAFREDLFFGEACTVIAEEEHFGEWTNEDRSLSISAIPYREELTDDLVAALHDRSSSGDMDVLLFHGSLDAPMGADSGDETDYRYFPVAEEELLDLGFDVYLAGHYHSPHLRRLDNGAEFAYPGTPVSTRRSEVGRRQVVLFDGDRGLSFEALDTPHYLDHRVTVSPGRETETIQDIEAWVSTHVSDSSIPRIVVDGVVDVPEAEFAEKLATVVETDWVTSNWLSVDHITHHPVIEAFENQLDERSWDERTKEAVRTRTLRAASTVAAMGPEWR